MEENYYPPLSMAVLTLREMYEEDATRVRRLHFHLKSGDYFALLATVMGFVEDTLDSAETDNPELKEKEITALRNLKKELIYLNNHYRIEPKTALIPRQD